jgi:hypothetical protein
MKLRKVLIGALCVCMSAGMVTGVSSVETQAKAKNAVYFKLNKGTLTIYGKGNMPSNMSFTENLKIKKVVVKKGVKTISNSAFYGCKNLKSVKLPSTVTKIGSCAFYSTNIKKVTIPKSVKKIGWKAFSEIENMEYVKLPGNVKLVDFDGEFDPQVFMSKVDTVEFSTNVSKKLFNKFDTKNYIVSENDPKYKSIDGVIYTKDGSEVVVLPSKEKIEIAEGCTTFNINSLFWGQYCGDDVWFMPQACVKEIVLPNSVTKVEQKKLKKYVNYTEQLYYGYLEKIVLKNKNVEKTGIDYYTKNFCMEYVSNASGDDYLKMGDKEKLWDL